jgi:hypothetical protein
MENKSICGNKFWYNENGIYHREDGPAVEWVDGAKTWYFNGKVHRLDGPAIEPCDGKIYYWYINGKNVTSKIIKWAKDNSIDLDNLKDVDKTLIKLVWADYGK